MNTSPKIREVSRRGRSSEKATLNLKKVFAKVGDVPVDRWLLKLNAAATPGDVWKAIESMSVGLTGAASTSLFLDFIGRRPMSVWSSGNHHKKFSPKAFKRLIENKTIRDYYDDRPEGSLFFLKEIFESPSIWREHPHYQEFFAPFGWEDCCGLYYVNQQGLVAALTLMRRADEGPFTAEALSNLLWMRPHFELACRQSAERVRMLSIQAEMGMRLGDSLNPGILFDWSLKATFITEDARKMLRIWGGEGQKVDVGGRDGKSLPSLLRSALLGLKASLKKEMEAYNSFPEALTRIVSHPADEDRFATLVALPQPVARRALPLFHLEFNNPNAAAASASAWTRAAQLLSPAEREVVRLVCQGYSNGQAAQELGKSPETVKKQVNAAFRRLKVKSRSQLIARLTLR